MVQCSQKEMKGGRKHGIKAAQKKQQPPLTPTQKTKKTKKGEKRK